MYKAVFFDRDGTLTRRSKEKAKERNAFIGDLFGIRDFEITEELSRISFEVAFGEIGQVNTLDMEERFWKKWYEVLIEEVFANEVLREKMDDGIEINVDEVSTLLCEKFPYYYVMEICDDVVEILSYLKEKGYKIGVISDTFPSLEQSLKYIGASKYIDSYTSSSITGYMKPEPQIYQIAMDSLEVKPEESIYVDDDENEVEGARLLGMTAFHIQRDQIEDDSLLRIDNLNKIKALIDTK